MNEVTSCGVKIKWDIPEHQEKIFVEEIDSVDTHLAFLVIKRIFDIVASLISLVILLVPMIVLATIIRIDSSGKAIYKQIRLGKNQEPFVIYKFRTMLINAEEDGVQWAEDDDPRVTRVGRYLRKSRIDELPQLFNIFRGDMSFVGPRPERPEFYDVFDTYIIGFRQRMLVRPGLTGNAQVNGGYDLKPEEKIVYDIYYIKNQSVKLDVQCLVKTVCVIFAGKGAR